VGGRGSHQCLRSSSNDAERPMRCGAISAKLRRGKGGYGAGIELRLRFGLVLGLALCVVGDSTISNFLNLTCVFQRSGVTTRKSTAFFATILVTLACAVIKPWRGASFLHSFRSCKRPA